MNRHLDKHHASLFLIATACLLLVMSFGLRSSFGLFVKPLSATHDWGREVISMALAVFAGIVHWPIEEQAVPRLAARKA